MSRQAAAKRFRIYRRRSGRPWSRHAIAAVGGSARRFVDRRVRGGRLYVYRLRSVSRSGRISRVSRTVRVRARQVATPPLGAPAPPRPLQAPGTQSPSTVATGAVANGPSVAGTEGCTLYGPYAAPGAHPPACWKPYSAESPFNRPIPANPNLDPGSPAIVSRLLSWGAPQDLMAAHSGSDEDYFHPLYFGRPSDPVFTVRCTVAAASCEVGGEQLHIPDAAQAAGGDDGHMTVIDQASGWEYDFWQVRSKPAGGGTLTVSHGGKTRIDGDGLGSDATAAWFGLAAGIIRGPEMQAGVIDHALFAAIKCTSGTSVFPAQPGTTGNDCGDFGLPTAGAPPLGARLQLAMSDAEIDALAMPAYRKVILRALAHYGMIVGDTNGGHAAWGVQVESGGGYTSFGEADPFSAIGLAAGLEPFDGGHLAFVIGSGVDWSRLRVVDACVSRGDC